MSNLVGRVKYKDEDTNPINEVLVSKSGSVVFRIQQNHGYGFNPDGEYRESYTWSFRARPAEWRIATDEEKEDFYKRVKEHR